MEMLLDDLDLSLYGTDTKLLCEKLRSSFRVIEYDGHRLPDIYQKYLRDKQFYSLFVRSHMGSGKTYQLKSIISNMRRSARETRTELRVLIITPKRTFATFVTRQLKDFVDYRHIRRPYSCSRYPRLVVQLQSLKNFDEIENDTFSVRGYSVVVLDEIHSIVDEMFSDLSDPRQKKRHMLTFIKILRAIPRWICLDAHLSLDLINILKEIDDESHRVKSRMCLINRYVRSDFKLIFYRKCLFNRLVIQLLKQRLYKSDKFRKYRPLLCTQRIADIVLEDNACLLEKLYKRLYARDFMRSTDRQDILVDLYDELSRGKNICVTTSTKRQAVMLKTLYEGCKFKVRLITGDSSEKIKSKFACDPDKFVQGCQLFIYTTAFQVGIDVSSKETYFDAHYVFIECSTRVASPGALIQAIGRIRTLRSKEYRIIVIDTKVEDGNKVGTRVTVNDLLPLSREQIIPKAKTNNVTNQMCNMLVDLHHKEKVVGSNVYLYVNMFIRLLRCKAEPYVMINDQIHSIEGIVNFHSFQYSNKQYREFVDEFISHYEDEIQSTLDKHINKIWKKLESSSIYVSTLVNNFNGFVSLPDDMSRAECLLKICEFTNMPFGFLHTYVFETCSSTNDSDDVCHLKSRYFENGVQSYFKHCSLSDLTRFKTLMWKFFQTCTNTGTCLWRISRVEFLSLLQNDQTEIAFCYGKFVNNIFSKSATTRHLFEKLMSRCMHLYINNNFVDVSEIFTYKRIVDLNKLLMYNVSLLSNSI